MPKATKEKTKVTKDKTKATKKTATKDESSSNDIIFMDAKKYTKLELRMQIRKRPDTYIGSVEPDEIERFILNDVAQQYFENISEEERAKFQPEGWKMVCRTLKRVAGLFKLFDELLVNTADHKRRNTGLTKIKINIDAETGIITISNNGTAIPCEMHEKEKVYVPELVFFHLLTGSNYDDTEERVGGGRNGYGAKLVSIFSKWMKIRVKDHTRGIEYTQLLENKPIPGKPREVEATIHAPEIKDMKEKIINDPVKCANKDLVEISFLPDYEFFSLPEAKLDAEHLKLFFTRSVDLAGTFLAAEKDVLVYLNDQCISTQMCRNFKQFIGRHLEDQYVAPIPSEEVAETSNLDDEGGEGTDMKDVETVPVVSSKLAPKFTYEQVNSRWEIAVAESLDGYHATSYVNSINTCKGGSHAKYIEDQLLGGIRDILVPKVYSKTEAAALKGDKLTAVRNALKVHMHLFINCLIVNPVFDTQSKEVLTTKREDFGSECELDEKFLKRVIKDLDLEDRLLQWKTQKDGGALGAVTKVGKNKRRTVDVEKLEDANDAGTENSHLTTLIITEGDSAKALAIAGLSVLGRDRYGVLPIRGKLLNCLEGSDKQISENREIVDIFKSLGAEQNRTYLDVKPLRYGAVMLMTDSDTDGTHIQMLNVGMFFKLVPSLLKLPGFLSRFETPIIILRKGKERTLSYEEKYFMSLPEFHDFQDHECSGDVTKHGWKIKYIKGLGTLESRHALALFADIDKHRYYFQHTGAASDDAIFLALGGGLKEGPALRKLWLQAFKSKLASMIDEKYDMSYKKDNKISYEDFVNNEYILHANADNIRSIPDLMDGFKPSQRKVMYVAFLRKLHEEIKVAQLCGSVAEKSAYHHGEVSLAGTIIGLAQNIVGKNNISLLYNAGQFGTREKGGKDHASARYIFTYLQAIARKIFHEDDDDLLQYLNDDGKKIEPVHFKPIIPMVLVNGSSGIGTGYSSSIPNYNPGELAECIRTLLDMYTEESTDEELLALLPALKPFYKSFKGEIIENGPQRFKTFGVLKEIDKETLQISELPIDTWNVDYKEDFLYKKLLHPKDLKTKKDLPPLIEDVKQYHTEFDVNFIIKLTKEQRQALENPDEYPAGLYQSLKLTSDVSTSNMVLFNPQHELQKYDSPQQIILEFFKERYRLYVERKAHLLKKMEAEQALIRQKVMFKNLVIEDKIVIIKADDSDIIAKLKEFEVPDVCENNYSNLLSMSFRSLTKGGIEKLEAEWNKCVALYEILKAKTIKDLWSEDLADFLDALLMNEQEENDVRQNAPLMILELQNAKLTKQMDAEAAVAKKSGKAKPALTKKQMEKEMVKLRKESNKYGEGVLVAFPELERFSIKPKVSKKRKAEVEEKTEVDMGGEYVEETTAADVKTLDDLLDVYQKKPKKPKKETLVKKEKKLKTK